MHLDVNVLIYVGLKRRVATEKLRKKSGHT